MSEVEKSGGGAGTAGRRAKYRLEQAGYAEVFKTSARTIKRWVKTGKDGGELPPLDSPSEMPQWWVRFYKQKVPDCILEAAGVSREVFKVREVEAVMEVERVPVVTVARSGTGYEEMLGRVRDAERVAYLEYEAALNAGDEGRLPLARKTWGELSKQLRELERDAHDILSRSGSLVERAVFERLVAEIHIPIVNGIRSMWRRVRAQMLAASEGQQDRVWQEEVDRLLSRLADSGFTAYE